MIGVDKTIAVTGAQTVAAIGNGKTFTVGVANGDPSATASWAFGPTAHGGDLALAAGPKGTFLLRPQRTALRPAAHRHHQGPPGQDARPDRTLVPDLRHRERRRRRARPRRLGAGPRPALPAHEQERNAPGGFAPARHRQQLLQPLRRRPAPTAAAGWRGTPTGPTRPCGRSSPPRRPPYPRAQRCPRATPSITPRTGSARCSRAASPTSSRTPTRASRATAGRSSSPGARCEAVDAHGKHLFLRFEGDLVIHSHLRMTGAWGVYRDGRRWGRSPRRAWLVLRARRPRGRAVRRARARAHDRRARALRPAHRRRWARTSSPPSSTSERFLARLREDDPTRPIGDALLDQRTIAGIGNLWKCEGCFEAGVDPWRPTGEVTDDEALRDGPRRRARGCSSPRATACRRATTAIYGRAGRPCPRCGARDPRRAARATTTARHTGARMPAMKPRARSASATRAPTTSRRATRSASFDAALAAGVDMVEFDVLPEHLDRSGRPAARPRLRGRARRDAVDARAGPRALRSATRTRASSSTSTSSCPATRSASSTRCASTAWPSARSISTMEHESLRVIRADAPEIRLGWSVPAARATTWPPRHARAGLRLLTYWRAGAARAGRRASVRGASTRSCPLGARHPAPGPRGRGAGGELYVGRSTTPSGSPRSSARGRRRSSRTTRGSSLTRNDLARRTANTLLADWVLASSAVPGAVGGSSRARSSDPVPSCRDSLRRDGCRAGRCALPAFGGGKVNRRAAPAPGWCSRCRSVAQPGVAARGAHDAPRASAAVEPLQANTGPPAGARPARGGIDTSHAHRRPAWTACRRG